MNYEAIGALGGAAGTMVALTALAFTVYVTRQEHTRALISLRDAQDAARREQVRQERLARLVELGESVSRTMTKGKTMETDPEIFRARILLASLGGTDMPHTRVYVDWPRYQDTDLSRQVMKYANAHTDFNAKQPFFDEVAKIAEEIADAMERTMANV